MKENITWIIHCLFPWIQDVQQVQQDIGYVFYREGGWSWSIPYIAGVYALSCEVKPSITPDEFWKTALRTGTTVEFRRNSKLHSLGKIINPVKLIQSLKNNSWEFSLL